MRTRTPPTTPTMMPKVLPEIFLLAGHLISFILSSKHTFTVLLPRTADVVRVEAVHPPAPLPEEPLVVVGFLESGLGVEPPVLAVAAFVVAIVCEEAWRVERSGVEVRLYTRSDGG